MARLHSLQRVLRSAGVTGDVQVDPGSDMKDMRYIGPGRQFVAGEAISVNAALVLSTFTPGSPLLTMVNADSNAAGKVEVWGFATTAVASGAVGTCVEWLIVTDLDTSLYTKDANVYLKSDAMALPADPYWHWRGGDFGQGAQGARFPGRHPAR